MDGTAVFAEIMLTITCLIGFACAVIVAAIGANKGIHFYAGIIQILSMGMMCMIIGVQCAIGILAYDAAKNAHPVPATVCVGVACSFFLYFSSQMADKFFANLPLVVYHMPFSIRYGMYALSRFNEKFSAEQLTIDAKKEAYELRHRITTHYGGSAADWL